MQTETLSISLPADLARMVRRTVETGAYASDSEVIREALRFWQERSDRLEIIRAELDRAATDPKRHSQADVRHHFDGLLSDAEKTARQ